MNILCGFLYQFLFSVSMYVLLCFKCFECFDAMRQWVLLLSTLFVYIYIYIYKVGKRWLM